MHQYFGILMAAVGLFMLVCGTMKSEFISGETIRSLRLGLHAAVEL